MSKAEEKALKEYPQNIITDYNGSHDLKYYKRVLYQQGYHQAEKDLELSWKDMECIIKHYQDIMAEKSRVFVRVEDYQELLKRFNKERK